MLDKFDKDIKEVAAFFNSEPVFDGAVTKEYYSTKPRILWILKEANSTGDNQGWDMRKAISELKTENGIKPGWEKTFKKMIYVTNGILNNISWNDELRNPNYNPDVIDELKKIAYINIRKTVGGGAIAERSILQEHYNESRQLLLKQIKYLDPNIIIFGNTYDFFKSDLEINELNNYGTCNAKNMDNRIYIDAYHPACRLKEETYFNDIHKAVESESIGMTFKELRLHN